MTTPNTDKSGTSYYTPEQVAGALGARLVPTINGFLMRYGQHRLPHDLAERLVNVLRLAIFEELTAQPPDPAMIDVNVRRAPMESGKSTSPVMEASFYFASNPA